VDLTTPLERSGDKLLVLEEHNEAADGDVERNLDGDWCSNSGIVRRSSEVEREGDLCGDTY